MTDDDIKKLGIGTAVVAAVTAVVAYFAPAKTDTPPPDPKPPVVWEDNATFE